LFGASANAALLETANRAALDRSGWTIFIRTSFGHGWGEPVEIFDSHPGLSVERGVLERISLLQQCPLIDQGAFSFIAQKNARIGREAMLPGVKHRKLRCPVGGFRSLCRASGVALVRRQEVTGVA
jgi:hypothetical protein